MGLELLNTLILTLLVVVAVLSLWVRDWLFRGGFWNLQLFDVFIMGGNGCGGCCFYRKLPLGQVPVLLF